MWLRRVKACSKYERRELRLHSQEKSRLLARLASYWKTANPTLVSVTVEFLLTHKEEEISGFFRDYLDSQDENIREKVLVYYAKNYSKDELKEALAIYTARPVYFYNVVCWLDRIVYAVSPLKEMFLRELESKFWIDLGIFGKSEAFDSIVTTSRAQWW
jgi:hypothetical protein